MKEYFGITILTLCPSLFKAIGNDEITSDKPPVVAYGAHSDAMNNIFNFSFILIF
jgi:hypothetical protein